ncbi:hypothetical protein SAMN05421670_3114 [Psychrobacillus psychrotolerans]|uniref:DUF2225 domain-containing protein n=1 Tax=Psychrobacillus psychrotolerans TaxID=126156 RepID=A0A1I6A303_9BACI|nr:DUF2225 domain-containing protein [Psychrobacillus psychrotolerans]SFQ63096.1 hypothetical protein SAMN05421670_3114 [Psychrobacillus psychrotolerans]
MELTPYYQKDIECLHCKQKFKTTKVRSKFIKVESHHTDFQPIYENKEINPLLYNIFVCEHCGFSFTDDFTKYFAPGVKEIIQEQISSKWAPRTYGNERSIEEGIMTYKLGILSGTLKKEKFVNMAGLALRTAWLYRLQDKQEEEIRFLEMARNRYAESYSNDDYNGTQMSESRMLYLIAELSRKIGDIEYATRYFSKVIEKQNSSLEPTIVEMAKDRWQEIRAQKEKEAIG